MMETTAILKPCCPSSHCYLNVLGLGFHNDPFSGFGITVGHERVGPQFFVGRLSRHKSALQRLSLIFKIVPFLLGVHGDIILL